ncbi:MAG: hypothetical protein KAU90_04970, partial [Sulfurovaceae bacterium]|nr:hypothetical protein [Sulfurovaceae bacterium]
MEYDTLDEFGEFEHEIEKGGEVVAEEAYIDIDYKPWLKFKVGHSTVPVGLNSQRHLPSLYLSTSRNISETTILPNTWHENGITAYGKVGENWNYQAMLMSGLNSEYFNSHHWIKSGDQKQFEYANADDLAFALRVDYGNILASHIGASLYMGNSNKNRNKAKLDSDGTVTIGEIHGVYDKGNVRLRGLALLGSLSDSEDITRANKSLPNKLGAVRTPVASKALAYFVEAGYDIAPMLGYSKSIVPFVKYDFVDSMYDTEGFVQDDDRYENSIITVGIDYFLTPEIVYKMDYSKTSFGDASGIEDLNRLHTSSWIPILMEASLVIAFREGLEAFLVMGIILAFLQKANLSQFKKYAWGGFVLGILSSIVLAFVFTVIVDG